MDKINILQEEIIDIKKNNKELLDQVAKLSQKGFDSNEVKNHINNEFAKKVKEAKSATDLIGKSFFVNVKDAKLGSNVFTDEKMSLTLDNFNAYDIMASIFGETAVDGNLINHTLHEARGNLATIDGQTVPECILEPTDEYNYDNAGFKINKYALSTPSSIEFTEFVNGGADNMINKLVIDLYNLFVKHSLHADATNQIGLFNVTSTRVLTSSDLATAGIITAEELRSIRYTANKSIFTSGVYMVPVSGQKQIEGIKDGDGNYIFFPANGTISGFTQVGTVFNRPLVVVPDDIWFKSGEDETSLGATIIAYVAPEAFEYYTKSIDEYTKLVNDLFKNGEVVIEVKQGDEAGCIKLSAMFLKGFGVTDPNAGALLKNPAVLRDAKATPLKIDEQMEEHKKLVIKKREESKNKKK